MNDVIAQIKAVGGGSFAGAGKVLGGLSGEAVRKWGDTGVPAERVLLVAEMLGWSTTPNQIRPDLYPHPDDGLPEALRGNLRGAA